MDFLSGEIAKLKRKEPPSSTQKYIKRGDLEVQRQREYRDDQAKLVAERAEREAEKLRRLEEHEASKRRKVAVKQGDDDDDAATTTLDVAAIRNELKELHEPVCLFGETMTETARRLARIKVQRDSLKSSTQAILREVYTDPDDKDLPDHKSIEIDRGWLKSDNQEKQGKLYLNLLLLFRTYIKQWNQSIDATMTAEMDLYKKAKEHLARLLIRLKARNLPSDILLNLTNVAKSLQEKNYMAANHAYLQMSIGKATWPVGVTMVGIHERAQRERLHQELDSAHILSDETTRQWLQSLKRLITQMEKTGDH